MKLTEKESAKDLQKDNNSFGVNPKEIFVGEYVPKMGILDHRKPFDDRSDYGLWRDGEGRYRPEFGNGKKIIPDEAKNSNFGEHWYRVEISKNDFDEIMDRYQKTLDDKPVNAREAKMQQIKNLAASAKDPVNVNEKGSKGPGVK